MHQRLPQDEPGTAPRAESVVAGGIRFHHVDAGPRGAPALVLLPGIIATHRYFRANIGALSRRFRVLAPDLPGFGRSDKPDAPYTIPWFAEQVVAFLDAKGIDRAHVLGNSLGGQIAMQLSLGHRERIGKLVLVAPAGLSTDFLFALRPFLRVAASARSLHGMPRVPDAAWSLLFRLVFPGNRELAARYTRGYQRAARSGDYPYYLRALFRAGHSVITTSMARRASGIRHPTLIIWGARDVVLPVYAARLLHRRIQSSELRVYPRSGHCPMADQPDRFNRDVLAFLDDGR